MTHLQRWQQSYNTVMNERIQQHLAKALEYLEAAQIAVASERHNEARHLLGMADDQLELGAGGNAAAGARRQKAKRLRAEVQTALGEQSDTASVTATAKRSPAPPHHFTEEEWQRVAAKIEGENLDDLRAENQMLAAQQEQARIERRTYDANVLEARNLMVLVRLSVLEGHYITANTYWDRLFDITTALRGAEGKARRAGTPDAEKARNYDMVREYNLMVRRWARGVA